MPTDKQSESSECPHDPKDSPQLSLDDQSYLDTRTLELMSQGVLPGVAARRARAELSEKKGARGRGGDISSNISPDVRVCEDPAHALTLTHPPTPLSLPLSRSPQDLKLVLQERGIYNINLILRKYKPAIIEQALLDFDYALTEGFEPRSRTAFFWSLLQ